MSENREKRIPRRKFMAGAAASAALIGQGCSIVPRHVLGGPRFIAPSEKLNIGMIGCGGRGWDNVRTVAETENIVALCDVDARRARRAFARFPDAARYQDFRLMLESETRLDAVVVSIPDHMHAPASVMAMQMGLHVYCEKPLTHSIHEARRMREVARRQGVATQMGNGGMASEGTRRSIEIIRAGDIGEVREIHVWTDRPIWPQGLERPTRSQPVPSTLDWDLWLGVAPERPYHEVYAPFVWRGWQDFGTGALGDIACHSVAMV